MSPEVLKRWGKYPITESTPSTTFFSYILNHKLAKLLKVKYLVMIENGKKIVYILVFLKNDPGQMSILSTIISVGLVLSMYGKRDVS